MEICIAERIARTNIARLSKDLVRGYDGNPRREAVAEVFWNAAYEVLSRIIWPDSNSKPLPETIRIGRRGTFIPIPETTWAEFRRELGLSRDDANDLEADRMEQTLRVVLVQQFTASRDAETPELHFDGMPFALRGLIVVLSFLAQMSRNGSPSSYRYEINSISRFADRELPWASLNTIDEGLLVREFFPHAGLAMDRTDSLWRVPYIACCRGLWKRFANSPVQQAPLSRQGGTDKQAAAQSVRDMPPGFLASLMGDHEIESVGNNCRSVDAPMIAKIPVSSEVPSMPIIDEGDFDRTAESVRLELRRLREENDCLRMLREVRLLESLLQPLLVAIVVPREERSYPFDSLPKGVRQAVTELLESPNVALFGDIGQRITIRLPSIEYVLMDDVPEGAVSGDAEYRVVRRGLRVLEHTMIPALIVPAEFDLKNPRL